MKAILAIGKNGEMGKDNQLLFPIQKDLERFKQLTMGAPLIMGRRTFESLPNVLPGRLHLVLTSDETYTHPNHNVIVVHNREEVLLVLEDYEMQPFVIGGPALFELFQDDIHVYHITYIHKEFPEADVRTTLLEKAVLRDFERTSYLSYRTTENGEEVMYDFIDFERHTITEGSK